MPTPKDFPRRWFPLKLRVPDSQSKALWNCEKRFVGVDAGRQSYKTELAKRKLVMSLIEPKPWSDPRYFYGAPTQRQAKLIAWEDLKQLVPKRWLRDPETDIRESELCIRTGFGTELHVVGMDKPERIEGKTWDGGVLDECFVAGTPVDTPYGTIPIEFIVPGQKVINAAGMGTVTAVKEKQKKRLAVVRSKVYTFVCSPNHPFLTGKGWVKAVDLRKGDYLVTTTEAMRVMWEAAGREEPSLCAEPILQQVLLGEVAYATAGNKGESVYCRSSGEDQQEGEGEIRGWWTDDRSEYQEDYGIVSIARPGCAREDQQAAERDRASANSKGRQRIGIDETTSHTLEEAREIIHGRSLHIDRIAKDQGQRAKLFHRHSKQEGYAGNRSGRPFSSHTCSSRIGSEEGRISQEVRVDGVEIYEQGSACFDRYSSGKDHVLLYDLTVDTHPSYSVASVLVHNCSDLKWHEAELAIFPMIAARNGWLWRLGVPKRTGVGATQFREFCEEARSSNDPETAAFTWPSSDVMTSDQLLWYQEHWDAKDCDEQLGGHWQDGGGGIFHAFSSTNERACNFDPELPMIVSCDFNVDPMAWVIGHPRDGGRYIEWFDEIWERDTNTPAVLKILWDRYGDKTNGTISFYGDATGRSRKSSASQSDYLHIANHKKFKAKGATVHFPAGNPAVADRFAACNAVLRNALGNVRCFFDPRCEHLLIDVKGRGYKPGTTDPDDKGDVGHATDAWGYATYMLFPIETIEGSSKITIHMPKDNSKGKGNGKGNGRSSPRVRRSRGRKHARR